MKILSMTSAQVIDEVQRRFGKGAFFSKAIYREILQKGNRQFTNAPEFASASKLAEKLIAAVSLPQFRLSACEKSASGVIKFATALDDGNLIETVILPLCNRTTVCVSSQVGCAMGCAMCQTGLSGFIRNLSVEEIVGQIFTARFDMKCQVDNIVFMGMGEPLDNFDNVIQAIRVLSDQRGFDIAPRSITISTSGIIPGIDKLAAQNLPNLRLALSINAADDALRSSIMPINKIYPLAELKNALRSFPLGRDGVLFIEYVLMAGVNDSAEMALKLVEFLHGLSVRVNVIPFNESSALPFVSPSREQTAQFCKMLTDHHLFVRIRESQGSEISAACGQLRGKLS